MSISERGREFLRRHHLRPRKITLNLILTEIESRELPPFSGRAVLENKTEEVFLEVDPLSRFEFVQ
jgi:hypothetical protein